MASVASSEVPIRPASTVILCRDGTKGLEVLMVRRNRRAVFMGGAHVFPGGAVDPSDDSSLARAAVAFSGADEEFRWRAAALRELFEEAGVLVGAEGPMDPGRRGEDVYEALVESGERLDADALEYLVNWVTPLGPPRRFDTRFFVASVSAEVTTDDSEVFDAEWVGPAAALEHAEEGRWQLEFPTIATLTDLAAHETADSVVQEAGGREPPRYEPRVVHDQSGSIRVLMPGDPGFEEAPG